MDSPNALRLAVDLLQDRWFRNERREFACMTFWVLQTDQQAHGLGCRVKSELVFLPNDTLELSAPSVQYVLRLRTKSYSSLL